jgi:hypothetical protein
MSDIAKHTSILSPFLRLLPGLNFDLSVCSSIQTTQFTAGHFKGHRQLALWEKKPGFSEEKTQ